MPHTTRERVLQLCDELKETELRLDWLRQKVENLQHITLAGSDKFYVRDALALMGTARSATEEVRTLIQDIGGA